MPKIGTQMSTPIGLTGFPQNYNFFVKSILFDQENHSICFRFCGSQKIINMPDEDNCIVQLYHELLGDLTDNIQVIG